VKEEKRIPRGWKKPAQVPKKRGVTLAEEGGNRKFLEGGALLRGRGFFQRKRERENRTRQLEKVFISTEEGKKGDSSP